MKKICTLVSVLLLAIAAQSQARFLKGILQSSQEVPANPSTAGGVVIVKYNSSTRFLELFGNYQGLTATASAAHIHSPGAPGINAPVLFNLNLSGGTTGTLNGTATLTAAQEADLQNGLMYVNVHNATYPGGEIRAQLTLSTDGQTSFFNGRLQGAQEVPPNSSTAMGSVMVLLDKTRDSVYLTGSFSGLTTAASAAHIHNAGLPGVNGPVFQNLTVSNSTSGTLHIAAPITAANKAEMLNGLTYVNVHNATYPGGEIRAQLTTLAQQRFLKATLQGSQEVPANSSTATGTIIVIYDTLSKYMVLTGDYQNLSAAAMAAHIHAPAAPGSNAPVAITLSNTGGTSGVLTAQATLTSAQETALLSGLAYVNVHNMNFPDGEIRGQLLVNAGESILMTGNLQGVQEVPANGSAASGGVTVLLDKAASRVYTTGYYMGLTTPASAGHIHKGQTGTNGPVVVSLSVTAATAGTITGNGTVSPGFADSLAMGYTYVNIHNATYPGGEIRAQLGNLVLPVKLLYFNGSKSGSNMALVWETAQEVNLKQFEIEQQDAGGTWVRKGILAATNSNSRSRYNFSDLPLATNSEYVLYRLKMIDADGKFSYSPVIRIRSNSNKASLSIATNPVTSGQLRYTVTGITGNEKANILVADYTGRIVLRATAGALQNNQLDVSALAPGMYKLIVQVNDTKLQESFSKY